MPTLLKTSCPHCQTAVRVNEAQVSKRVRCPSCRQAFEVKSVEVASHDSVGDAKPATNTISGETAREARRDTPVGASGKATQRLGRFELREVIGQGAFGRVYRAYDPQLDREVALKVPTFGSHDTKRVRRFLTEAKAAAKLRHPNIVPVYESGELEGQYFIAAQFVAGQTLAARIEAGPVEFREAAQWTRALADALAYAHAEGIVHRDIKPENIMLDAKGQPQIMDFGLAKRSDDAGQTIDGTIMGTPAYMPPEQASGDQSKVGPHSDQYSLGAVLYELLTGKRPFDGASHSVIAQVLSTEPTPIKSLRADVPKDLEAICQKAMSKEASGRYFSTSDLAEDFARWLRGDTTIARPVGPVERLRRWAKRNPAIAGLSSAVAMVVMIAVVAISASLWQTTRALAAAQQARDDALKSEEVANDERRKAKEQEAIATKNFEEAENQRKAAIAQKTEAERNAKIAAENLARFQREESARLAAEREKLALAGAKETLERDATKLAAGQQHVVYVDRLNKALEALNVHQHALGRKYLDECPPSLRGFEWRYLAAWSREDYSIRDRLDAPQAVEYLVFSPDGKWLLAGADRRIPPAGTKTAQKGFLETPWNAVWNLETKKLQELSLPVGDKRGGRVCAFSANSEEVLTVSNTARNQTGQKAEAQAHLWRRLDTTWERAESFPAVDGFPLACWHSPEKEWMLLVAETELKLNAVQLQPSLKLHNLRTKKSRSHIMPTGAFVSGAANEGCTGFYALLQLPGASPFGQLYHALVTDAELELLADFPGLNLPSGVQSSSSEAVGDLLLASPSQWISRGQRQSVVYSDRPRPELEQLAAGGVAAFDPSGKRFFTILPDRNLELYDPNSPVPTQRLLQFPGSQFAAATGIAFSPNGNLLCVYGMRSFKYDNRSIELVSAPEVPDK